jgi:hypothetical protein
MAAMALLASREASAKGAVASVGPLLSLGSAGGRAPVGLGGEATLVHFNGLWTKGAFAQVEAFQLDRVRFAGGLQSSLMGLAGVEAGVSYESGRNEFASNLGLHFAPFVAFPLKGLPPDGQRAFYPSGSVAIRFDTPIVGMSAGQLPPKSVQLVFTIKLTWTNGLDKHWSFG